MHWIVWIFMEKKKKTKVFVVGLNYFIFKSGSFEHYQGKKSNEWMGQRLKIDSNYKFTSISNENYNFALEFFSSSKNSIAHINQMITMQSDDFHFYFDKDKSITALYLYTQAWGKYFEWIHGKMLLDHFNW